MAKIWCEKCNGKGRDVVCISKPGVRGFECIDKGLCPVCQGKGYTEEQMVSVAKVREWADKNNSMDSYQRRMLRLSELRDYLDSM